MVDSQWGYTYIAQSASQYYLANSVIVGDLEMQWHFDQMKTQIVDKVCLKKNLMSLIKD